MAADRSFTGYIASRFENEFYSSIDTFIEENAYRLDLNLRKIRNIGQVSLSDTEVKSVSVNDLPDMKIEFAVILEAEIEVAEGDHHYDDSEICRQWFMVCCTGDLACDLDDFKIASIAIYSNKNKNPEPLSDSLVPYIKKEQLESVATDFLYRHFPEAIKSPMAIDPIRLAEKMGLDVQIRNITKDFTVFGQIYFHDAEAQLYDSEMDQLVTISVKSKTIFVDPQAYFLRNLGAVNNTIVHECVHWDKHRKAFELERLYNKSASRIKCQVAGGIKGNNKEATDWMEWQANALAPKIQMPLAMFKTKAFEYIIQFKKESGTDELIDVIQPVIDALANFFCVSRIAAKIRMIEVGYEEAISAFTYIDGRYIKPHSFKKGALKRNQTFSIGAIDAAIQSIFSLELNALVKEGSYQYVESHLVLNHPKYIEQDLLGNTRLTDYAKTHMDECCIKFDLSISSNVKERYHSECFLNRDEASKITFAIEYRGGYEHASPEVQAKLLRDDLVENARMYSELPTSYTRSLDMVKKWRGITYIELEKKTKINERTIRRIIKDEESCTINTLILICLGLRLPPIISNHIIDNSPVSLNLAKSSHQWYHFVLTQMYNHTMDEIRYFLMNHNVEPL